MSKKKYFTFILLMLFFSGCATTYENTSGLEPEKNISHAANQTLSYSVNWVDEATHRVLDQMDIMVINKGSSPEGKSIKAATIDQDILIEFSSLTPNSTVMKINVQYPEDSITKSTANQIFYKTRQFLLSNKPPKKLDIVKPNQSTRNFFSSE